MKVNFCFDIVLAVKDHDAAVGKYSTLFGMNPLHVAAESLIGEMRCTVFTMWNLGDKGMVFSIVSSTDPKHPISEHIASKGEGLYTVGFEADDLGPILAQARSAGVKFFDDSPMDYDLGKLLVCRPETTDNLPIFIASHKEGWWQRAQRGQQ